MSKMTISFEYEDSNNEFLNKVMEMFKKGEMVMGAHVYAASHDCLFEKIEDIEEICGKTHLEGDEKVWEIQQLL